MTLHLRTAGPRDAASRGPLLFIHGFPFDGSMWDRQLEGGGGPEAGPGVPAGWWAVAPDLRGFGRSPLDGDAVPTGREVAQSVALDDEPVLTMARHADDLAALLDAEGGAPAVVCGLSMGGYVALALLRRHPRLVRALVLTDTRAGADDDEGRENRRRTAATVRQHGARPLASAMLPSLLAESTVRDRPEIVERVRRMIEDTAPATLIGALAGMAVRPDATGEIPGIGVPTLVVVGEHDAITPPAVAREMAEAIPGARLVTIPGAGHLAPLEAPEAFNGALGEFLQGL